MTESFVCYSCGFELTHGTPLYDVKDRNEYHYLCQRCLSEHSCGVRIEEIEEKCGIEIRNNIRKGGYGEIWFYASYVVGSFHREDGPAVIFEDGTKKWFFNNNLHRIGGPAVEYCDGKKTWYVEGKLHNEHGPAIITQKDRKRWYLNNEQLTEQEWHERTKGNK